MCAAFTSFTHTLTDWFSYLKQLHQKRLALSLNCVSAVADRLQLKQFSCPVITVGGTNGKGSCTKTLESIYTQAGFRVGLYTSPHLLVFNERIRIDNQDCDDQSLLRAFAAVENARENSVLSFFAFVTLAALLLFQEANCDVIILEVGLGGRLDAVNIVESDVSIITNIALDHTEILGNSRELIAFEKAAIARAKKPLISGDLDPPKKLVESVLEKNAMLFQINRDFFCGTDEGGFYCTGKNFQYRQLPIPHLKAENVACAIAAVEQLQLRLPVMSEKIAAGMGNTVLPGRFEIVNSFVPCVLDVAHNPAAATWLAVQYAQLPRVNHTVAIVGMLTEKAMIEIILPLISQVQTWLVCDLRSENLDRGADGCVIHAFLKAQGIKNCYTFVCVADAMTFLRDRHCQDNCDRALIFGSFYTVAAAKKWLAQ